jgi:hypothetical protein
VFKRNFSTIFQLYIDLSATFPGANMVQDRYTLGYLRTRTFYTPETPSVSTLILSGRTYPSQNVRLTPEKCPEYLVGRQEWIFKDFFFISRGEHVKHFVIDVYL